MRKPPADDPTEGHPRLNLHEETSGESVSQSWTGVQNMKKPPTAMAIEGLPSKSPNHHRRNHAMSESTATTQQQAPHIPSIPGMVVDLFDAASLAVALVSAFAIKFVAAAVTK